MTKRTNYCGLITETYLNQEVNIHGWVHRRRDLGGLIFFDIRDREGLVQVVVEPENACFNVAETVKHEYVLSVTGMVRERPQANPDLKTGKVEIVASEVAILNTSQPIPILIDDETTSEVNRLSHRVIDLRSHKMQHNLRLRHKITMAMRNYLDNHNFIDLETPCLTLSTPGGARDFLVPSRLHKGEFYALPQSPQLFKQLLMVSGLDRYYQIVKCFRDEELRADRQPEFTQVDIEASFVTEEDVREFAEEMIRQMFQQVLNIDLGKFPIMTHADAMYYYGSDKPDLRLDLKFVDLTKDLQNCGFTVFNQAAKLDNGRIVALKLPSTVSLSRKEIDTYTEFVKTYGAKGLAYLKINDVTKLDSDGIQSPIAKFLTLDEIKTIINTTNAKDGEIILFGADKSSVVNAAMGALRLKLGKDKNLFNSGWKPLWVVDFPLFEYDEETKKYVAAHHPFTSPKDEHINLLQSSPGKCLAKAYDMVLNGAEIGGGSVRIHQADIQAKAFTAIGMTDLEANQKFGFLLDNLQFGAPPHAGIAFGLDRIAALMCNADSIRDVIAFPKTTRGQCLLTQAPGAVGQSQLEELGITIIKN